MTVAPQFLPIYDALVGFQANRETGSGPGNGDSCDLRSKPPAVAALGYLDFGRDGHHVGYLYAAECGRTPCKRACSSDNRPTDSFGQPSCILVHSPLQPPVIRTDRLHASSTESIAIRYRRQLDGIGRRYRWLSRVRSCSSRTVETIRSSVEGANGPGAEEYCTQSLPS